MEKIDKNVCNSLIKEGSEEALDKLIKIYLTDNDSIARYILHMLLKVEKRTTIIPLVTKRLSNHYKRKGKTRLLVLGYLLDKEKFLFMVLEYFFISTQEWKNFKYINFKTRHFTKIEQQIIFNFMVKHKYCNRILFSKLTLQDQEKLKNYFLNKKASEEIEQMSHLPHHTFSIGFQFLTENIIDYLREVAERIQLKHLYIGSSNVSNEGLRMIQDLFDLVYKKQGTAELFIGTLQKYPKNHELTISRQSVQMLNAMIECMKLKVYTCENTLFCGNFFLLKGEKQSILVTSSLDISQLPNKKDYLNMITSTEFLKESRGELQFFKWYFALKKNSTQICGLTNMKIHHGTLSSGVQTGQKTWELIPATRVNALISKLTDEEVRIRLGLWMQHNPSKIYKKLGIPAFENYIFFWYPEHNLAVFESFKPRNAYFVFKTHNYELLFEQLRALTKTEMIIKNTLQYHGYHTLGLSILKERISSLFN